MEIKNLTEIQHTAINIYTERINNIIKKRDEALISNDINLFLKSSLSLISNIQPRLKAIGKEQEAKTIIKELYHLYNLIYGFELTQDNLNKKLIEKNLNLYFRKLIELNMELDYYISLLPEFSLESLNKKEK